MADAPASLKVREDGGITCVQFADKNLLDAAHIAGVQKELDDIVSASQRPFLLVDFYNVEMMSSACIGMLVALQKKIREKNGQLRLANISPKLMKIFTITKLDQVLRISSTRTGAMNVLMRILKEGSMDSP
jgi:anti-sigma B factor antagonist